MSKSLGNYIAVTEPPDDMFGKLMSISDDLMWRYFDLLSFRSNADLAELRNAVGGRPQSDGSKIRTREGNHSALSRHWLQLTAPRTTSAAAARSARRPLDVPTRVEMIDEPSITRCALAEAGGHGGEHIGGAPLDRAGWCADRWRESRKIPKRSNQPWARRGYSRSASAAFAAHRSECRRKSLRKIIKTPSQGVDSLGGPSVNCAPFAVTPRSQDRS